MFGKHTEQHGTIIIGIGRQIQISSLWETSTGSLIFCSNKEIKRWILVWHIAVKDEKWIANAELVFLKIGFPSV